MRLFRTALLLVILLCLAANPALAQQQAAFSVGAPDLSAFPQVELTFTLRGEGGAAIESLVASEVSVLEDDKPLPVEVLRSDRPGMQIFVAVNAAPPLAIRDANGIARYDRIRQVLSDWAERQSTNARNEYFLFTNDSAPALRLQNPADWLAEFLDYQPNMRAATAGLASLNAAIDQAGIPAPRPWMQKVLLYITPALSGELLSPLAELNTRAQAAGLHVFIWQVGPPAEARLSTEQLSQLAQATGGQYMEFSGSEALPSPDDYFRPFGVNFTLQYQSALRSPGEHTLAVKIEQGGFTVQSEAQPFTLNLKPPNPLFLSPPVRIIRTAPEESEAPLTELSPQSAQVAILVEFPDDIRRELTAARFYVDGFLLVEQKTPPFDQFTWDLTGYTESGSHTIRVEVTDTLGLKNSTLELPVEVEVIIPQISLWERLTRRTDIVTALAILLAAMVLGAVLIVGGRKIRTARVRPKRGDPVTQPLSRRTRRAKPAPAVTEPLSAWPTLPVSASASEQLIRLDDELEPVTGSPIPLTGAEITLGNDPSRATLVLNDPALNPLHARLLQQPDGSYIIRDEGSIAGTWVNFKQLPPEGRRLEQDDILRVGMLFFRYQTNRPYKQRTILVEPYKEIE